MPGACRRRRAPERLESAKSDWCVPFFSPWINDNAGLIGFQTSGSFLSVNHFEVAPSTDAQASRDHQSHSARCFQDVLLNVLELNWPALEIPVFQNARAHNDLAFAAYSGFFLFRID